METFKKEELLDDKERNKRFRFKDERGTYEMSEELKSLVDVNPEISLRFYVNRLAHVAGAQIDEYYDREDKTLFTPLLREGEDPVKVSNFFENISRLYEGKEGMRRFIEARNDLIEDAGIDFVLKLEAILGIDSRGIEAGDERPLLGVNEKMLVALDHYRDKLNGYKEIE